MGTKQFDSATNLITFTRASGGTALRRVGYGPELVTNGTFDTDLTGWNTGFTSGDGVVGWSNGGATLTSTKNYSADKSSIRQVLNLPAGRYLLSFEAASTDASFAWALVGPAPGSGSISGNGWWPAGGNGVAEKLVYHTGGNVYFEIRVSGTTIIDNISVKQIVYDVATDPLVLYNHPINTPRIDHNADGTAKGLLIEEARTNLVTYSENFTHGSWSKTGLTAAAASETGPDGHASMSTITVSATTSAHEMLQGARSVSSNAIISGSFVVRAGTVRYVSVRLYSHIGYWSVAVFDLTTGTLTQESNGATSGTILNSGIENLPNGLYRLSLTATNSFNKSYLIAQVHNTGTPTLNAYGGDTWLGAGETIELGLMQHEVGGFVSSYIPTSGASATRAADIASIPTSDFGYNSDAGSVYVDGTFLNGDTIVTLGSTTITADADGNKKYTATYSSTPSATEIALNQGTYSDFKYYPRRLSNAQLQELTT